MYNLVNYTVCRSICILVKEVHPIISIAAFQDLQQTFFLVVYFWVFSCDYGIKYLLILTVLRNNSSVASET